MSFPSTGEGKWHVNESYLSTELRRKVRRSRSVANRWEVELIGWRVESIHRHFLIE